METELRKIKDTRDARMEEMEQQLRMYHQINHVFVGQQDTLVGYQVSECVLLDQPGAHLTGIRAGGAGLSEGVAGGAEGGGSRE